MGTHPIFESDFDCLTVMESRIDLSKPQYDQNTYWGRVSHFSKLTDPRNLALSDSELTRARDIVNHHKSGENTGLSVAALWNEKYKYDSAYHPESGHKMFLPGRMSAWVPANMCITGAMLAFQKTPGQIIFWQFANQSVNAAVNFTNRSGGDEIPTTTLACNFVGATTLAVGVAMGVKRFAPKSLSRLSPFFAVCAANCLNTPLMRSSELSNSVRRAGHGHSPLWNDGSRATLSATCQTANGGACDPGGLGRHLALVGKPVDMCPVPAMCRN